MVRHALDLADKNIFDIPNPVEVTFKDIKTFDAENSVTGNLLSKLKPVN